MDFAFRRCDPISLATDRATQVSPRSNVTICLCKIQSQQQAYVVSIDVKFKQQFIKLDRYNRSSIPVSTFALSISSNIFLIIDALQNYKIFISSLNFCSTYQSYFLDSWKTSFIYKKA